MFCSVLIDNPALSVIDVAVFSAMAVVYYVKLHWRTFNVTIGFVQFDCYPLINVSFDLACGDSDGIMDRVWTSH